METRSTPNQPAHKKTLPRKTSARLVVIPVALVVLLGFLAAWMWLIPHGQRIKTDGYQVVYLTNNQAYFGKLQNTEGSYLVIEGAYTAQEVQAPATSKNKTPETQTTLVKVRDQVAGPEDSIAIRADQVLFWQNLRSDSKVSQAIEAKE
ncbi:TPA: hypothetical protein DIV49_00090 [Candidatus Saccharibacteria bacterium]|nr:hypothetical protein [Candidatus Saccharibacteria bacterium]HRJ91346.1 hypothetical protein [Candidatus Saccharibacteria bacterium]